IFVNPLYCTGSKCRLKLFAEEIYPVRAVAPELYRQQMPSETVCGRNLSGAGGCSRCVSPV
ncbi:TPA: hypothetical protein ACLAX1_002083, partial [Neisseria meningitidis]